MYAMVPVCVRVLVFECLCSSACVLVLVFECLCSSAKHENYFLELVCVFFFLISCCIFSRSSLYVQFVLPITSTLGASKSGSCLSKISAASSAAAIAISAGRALVPVLFECVRVYVFECEARELFI